jgi:uncharacterized protein YcfJ
MFKTFSAAALAALVALPLIAGPTAASASCRGRANTGTVIGGVGGALVGNSISKGGGGAIIGGLGGAVLGHQIAKSGCTSSAPRRAYYRRGHSHYASNYNRPADRQAYPADRPVYYDRQGNAISPR